MVNSKIIVHFIYSLGSGGAENILTQLVINSNKTKYTHIIICFSEPGFFSEILAKNGIKVYYLYANKKRLYNLSKLIPILKANKPYLIQSWNYSPNFITLITKLFFWRVKIIWSLRTSIISTETYPRLEVISNKICSIFSSVPKHIVGCGDVVKSNHIDIYNYKADNFIIIYNGCDTTKYYIDATLGLNLRERLNIKESEFVIAFVARFNPVKGIFDFLESLLLVKNRGYLFKVIMAGRGNDVKNKKLYEVIERLGLASQIVLLGEVENTAEVYNAANLFVLSSHAESFGNVMCEAMSSGLPVIATNVGEATNIIGQYGVVVPTRDTLQLANGIIHVLDNQFEYSHRDVIRKRIVDLYSLTNMVSKYEQLYDGVS